MKKLRDGIHINDTIFRRLDAGEKNLIQILALTAPVSAIVAAIVLYYSINLLVGSGFIALVGGGFIGYLLYLHDSSLLAESGTTRAYVRLLLSMVLAVVMAVPMKITLLGEDLQTRVLTEIREYNLGVDQQLMEAKQVVFDEEKEIANQIVQAGKRFGQTKQSQELVEARRAKEIFNEQKEERIAMLEETYTAMKQEEEVTKLDLAAYYFSHMFDSSNPKELFINLSVFILLLLVEALPAIVRLKLEDSTYLEKINHGVGMQRKTDNEIETLEREILDIDDLMNLPDKVDKIRLWKALDIASKNGFSKEDTEDLYHLSRQYRQAQQQQKTPPPPPPKDNGKAKGNEEFADFDYS